MRINRVNNIKRYNTKKIIFVYDEQDFSSTASQLIAEINRILDKNNIGKKDGWIWVIQLNDLTAIAEGRKEA